MSSRPLKIFAVLRYQHFAWIIAGLTPLVLFAIFMLYLFTKQQEKEIDRLLYESANNAAFTVDRAIREQIGILNGLAVSRSLDSSNFDSFRVNSKRLKAIHPEWRTVILTDDHQQVFNLQIPKGTPLAPIRDPKSLKEMWTNKTPSVGGVVFGHIPIRVPVMRGNRILFTLVVPITPSYFSDILNSFTEPMSWGFMIVGHDGIVIASSPDAPASTSEKVPERFRTPLNNSQTIDGLLFSRTVAVKTSNWNLFLFTGEGTIVAPFMKIRKIVYVSGLFVVVLAVILVLTITIVVDARRESKLLRNNLKERKKAERILRESQQSLREAQRLAKIGNWVWEIATDKLSWSKEVFQIFGRDFKEPLASYAELQKYHTSSSWQELSAKVEIALREGTEYEVDSAIILPDGSQRWITTRGIGEKGNDDKVVKLRGTIQDITERKKIEESLRESEIRYRTLITESPDALAIMEGEPPQIQQVNPAFATLFGIDKKEVKKLDLSRLMELVAPEDLPIFSKYLSAAPKSLSNLVFEIRIIRRDSSMKWVEISGTTVRIGDKLINQTIYKDVTERKQTEEMQEQLRTKIAESQRLESIGRLAGGVAHDYNNMLGVILGYAESVQESLDAQDARRDELQEIINAAQHSADITRQLLAFARKQPISPKQVDLNERVENMLKMLRHLIGEDIDLEFLPGKNLDLIKFDPTQLDQILANLCLNARDAIGTKGKIVITTENVFITEELLTQKTEFRTGKFVCLVISDNGSGIEKTVLENIFEPFFTTKGFGKGTGLGLATVYGIVKQNNGFIDVSSELGKGATFRIYIPKSIGETADFASTSVVGVLRGNGETVLVVEDEKAILQMCRQFLISLGYTVITAATPQNALNLVEGKEENVDLLLTDVIMPEMDGRELASYLQSIFSDMKTIYMSGYTADVIAQRGMLEEGVAFIQKPFSKSDLAAKVHAVLNRRGPGNFNKNK